VIAKNFNFVSDDIQVHFLQVGLLDSIFHVVYLQVV
jgi:hypothetical protein